MKPSGASRPRLPDRDEYGTGKGDLLEWATATGWLAGTRYYWLCTTCSDGRPHAVAVWAVWVDERLWFATSPETLTARNLGVNPEAVMHTESAVDVAIAAGTARQHASEDVPASVVDAYHAKYDWKLEPHDQGMPFYSLLPRQVLAWRSADVRGTSRRWRLD